MDVERRRLLRGLYAITPEEPDTGRLLAKAEACIAGGARVLQYRAKGLEREARRAQALALAELCRANAVPFIVNDAVDLALEAGADGVHLGREDGSVAGARARFAGLIGVSCYDDARRAPAAAREGADYVAIGSLFPSSTKPGAARATLEALGEARRLSGLPVAAIGGITAANARAAIGAGADMVAVISAVFDAPDVRAAARAIARLFETAPGAEDVRAQPGPV